MENRVLPVNIFNNKAEHKFQIGGSLDQEHALEINKSGWDKTAAIFYGECVLPRYGPLAQSETELQLIGEVQGARALEIGCGSGHSLLYLAQHGAVELWGLDLSHTQIEFASALLTEHGHAPHLFEAPMEENPGLPLGYFDWVVSIYALDWTVDLARTLKQIAAYLKPGGHLVFSCEHPFYRCLGFDGQQFIVKRSYQFEGQKFTESWLGVPIVRHARKLSTYLNGLIETGLMIERVVESAVDPSWGPGDTRLPESWYTIPRAELVPTTLIIKARKDTR